MEKVVSFCGVERGSFVYYVAALLSKAGNAVLVVDNSNTNDIFGAVSDGIEMDYVVKQNITYTKNVKFSVKENSLFDYVLIWQGMNIRNRELKMSDMVILIPDYTPHCLRTLNEKILDKDQIAAVFMRDYVPSRKIKEKTAANMLGISDKKILGATAYDLKDYENYLAFLYNGRQTFSNLTPDYNDCLKYAFRLISEQNKNKTDKLFKKAKNSKTF